MDEKIGINIKEASEILGISKQLMTELTKLKDFPCIKFERRIVINKPQMIEWFNKNSEKQKRVLNFLIQNEGIQTTELEIITDTTNAVLKALEKKEYIEIIEEKIERNPFLNKDIKPTKKLKLTEEQVEK